MSKLVQGLIPAKTECPFKDGTCPLVETCPHKGVNHPVAFSCAAARFWDTMPTKKEKP